MVKALVGVALVLLVVALVSVGAFSAKETGKSVIEKRAAAMSEIMK